MVAGSMYGFILCDISKWCDTCQVGATRSCLPALQALCELHYKAAMQALHRAISYTLLAIYDSKTGLRDSIKVM